MKTLEDELMSRQRRYARNMKSSEEYFEAEFNPPAPLAGQVFIATSIDYTPNYNDLSLITGFYDNEDGFEAILFAFRHDLADGEYILENKFNYINSYSLATIDGFTTADVTGKFTIKRLSSPTFIGIFFNIESIGKSVTYKVSRGDIVIMKDTKDSPNTKASML